MFLNTFLKFLTTSTGKAYGHDRSNKFHTTYSCYRMTPTMQPKPQNPSIVFCGISVAVVTISLVVRGWKSWVRKKTGVRGPTPIWAIQRRRGVIQKWRDDRSQPRGIGSKRVAQTLQGPSDLSESSVQLRNSIQDGGALPNLSSELRATSPRRYRCGRVVGTSLGSPGPSGVECSNSEFDQRRGNVAKLYRRT